MPTSTSTPPSSSASPAPGSSTALDLLSFYRLVGRLKTTKRTGWVRSNVSLPESISDHMYRMCMMAMTAPEKGIDNTHAMKLALVHDLAEALVGDITPHDGVSKADKYTMERDAMHKIKVDHFEKYNSEIGDQLVTLWQEYEEGKTKEARFVKQLDKLEMIVQADEYETQQNVQLDDFFQSTVGVFSSPLLQQIDHSIRMQRNERNQSQTQPSDSSS